MDPPGPGLRVRPEPVPPAPRAAGPAAGADRGGGLTAPVEDGRRRVHHVITRLIVGGAQQNTVASCALVDPSRFDSLLLTGPETGPEGELFSAADADGVRVEVVDELRRAIAPATDVRALRVLRRRFEADRPAVVHTHSSKAGIVGRLAAHRAGVPGIVHTVHGWSFTQGDPWYVSLAYRYLEKLSARWCHVIVCVAEADRATGLRHGIGRPDQYRLIRSGFRLDDYTVAPEEAAAVRAELDVPAGHAMVVTVGRLAPQKDPLTFVRAAASVAAATSDATFVMVGDGPLSGEVARAVSSSGFAERFRLTGLRHDVPAVLAAADVFVLTSLWEGLPRVVPQAIAAGLPIVASHIDGIAEAVTGEEIGVLVAPGDVEGFAKEIRRRVELRDGDDHHLEARRRKASEFDLSLMISGLENLYEELTGPRARS